MSTKLSKMKFKDFTWPNNPSIYDMDFNKRIVKHSFIFINKEEIENMGMEARVFSGRGAFFGKYAYYYVQRLATIFQDKTPGLLYHPIWQTNTVHFTKFKVTNEPTPNYVEYTFEFVEHTELDIITESALRPTSSNSSPGAPQSASKSSDYITHIVRSGETLSGIGAYYGVSWKQIADDNKNIIKNPNQIQVGWKLIINNPKKNTSKSNNTSVSKSSSSTSTDSTKYNTGDKAYDRFMNTFGDRLGKEPL